MKKYKLRAERMIIVLLELLLLKKDYKKMIFLINLKKLVKNILNIDYLLNLESEGKY